MYYVIIDIQKFASKKLTEKSSIFPNGTQCKILNKIVARDRYQSDCVKWQ